MSKQVRQSAMMALRIAEGKISRAILQQNQGNPIPSDIRQAMDEFFPRQNVSFLNLLLRRIQLVQRVIPSVRLKRIDRNYIADQADSDANLHVGALGIGMPARAFPQKRYIAIYLPAWDNHRQFQPGILIHESFHYYFGHMRVGHPENNRRINPFAYQGLVCRLGNLPIGATLRNNLR